MGSSQTTQPTSCYVLERGASTAMDSTIGKSCVFIPPEYPKFHIGEPVTADDMKWYLGRIPGFRPHDTARKPTLKY
jgi:hypothetical protein